MWTLTTADTAIHSSHSEPVMGRGGRGGEGGREGGGGGGGGRGKGSGATMGEAFHHLSLTMGKSHRDSCKRKERER